MKKILLFLLFIFLTNFCYGKEIKISEQEIKNKIVNHDEQIKKLSDKEIVSELNSLLTTLPKNMNESLRAMIIIEQIGKRNITNTKAILEKIIKRGEESPNKFVKGFTPEFSLMSAAKIALLRMELNKELLRKNKITIEGKADYLIQELKNNNTSGYFLLEEIAPEIVPKLLELLNDKDEKMKEYALLLLEKSNNKSIQNKIIKIAEEEFQKPKHGLYFQCQRVLENVGDKKTYDYLKKRLNHTDPQMRHITAHSLIKFWDRGIVTQREITESLMPLLNDKNKEVSKNVKFYLLNKGLIKE